MGQQCSAHADGTVAVTSSQHSSISSHITSESKIKTDSADTRPNAAWKNSISTLMSSGRGESEMAEFSSLRSRTELEVSRMSIRAAIDTVIENCLSSNNDYSPQADSKTDDDLLASDCSNEEVGSDLKNEFVSSRLRSSDSPNDDSNKPLKSSGSEGNQLEDCYISDDHYSCVEVKKAQEVQLRKENSEIKDSTGIFDDPNYQTKQGQDISEVGMKTRVNEQSGLDTRISKQSLENSNSDVEIQPRASTEKQTFSAYLQERLKTIDLEKCEELSQLAMSKEIQSHGQMLMWEVAKKSPDNSAALKSPFTTSGPVKLQNVIDMVLDNSLRNESQSAGSGIGDSSTGEQVLTSTPGLQSHCEVTLKEKLESSENIPAPVRTTNLCFKDHIEKVLVESFLSFEEDERQKALKEEAENNKSPRNVDTNISGINTSAIDRHQMTHSSGGINSPSVHIDGLNGNKNTTNKPSGDKDKQQNTNKDGTISVQDIVDQVISQTEMISKLLTPSARDANKLTASSGHADVAVLSSSMYTQANPGILYHSSSQNRALVEAQRHAVQKEHQSSTTMGRKRGRPRLGSPVNSAPKSSHDPGKSGYHDVRGSHMTSHISDHPHILHMNHHQFGTAGGIPSMMVSKNVAPPASVMIHQTHHMRQKSPSPSSVKKCLPGSASSGYQLSPHDSHHHYHQQHLPSHIHHQQNQTRTHDGNQMASSNAPPPPLILADKVKNSMSGGNGLMPVYHIPSQSCSCHSCRMFFSQLKPHPHVTQHQHHQFSKQTSTTDCDQRSSGHHSSSATTHTDSSAFYLLPVSLNSETPSPVVSVHNQGPPLQASRSAFTAGPKQRRDLAMASREPVSDGINPRSYPQDYYRPSQSQISQTHLVKPAFIDTRFTETEQVIHVDQLVHAEDSFERMTNDSSPRHGVVERPKLEVTRIGVPIRQDDDHPLDLSVKPCPARSQDNKTNFNNAPNLPRENSEPSMKNAHYRLSSTDHNPGSQGHYVEHDGQGTPSGHHLQRLENSVDRFLSYHRPEAHFPLSSSYSQHPLLRQQQPKMVQLSPTQQTPPEAWSGHLHHYSQGENHYSEPHSRDQLNSIHSHQSDVSFTHRLASSTGQMPQVSQPHYNQSNTESSEERCRYPSMMSQQNIPKNMVTTQHIQPDHSTQNQSQISRNISPASFQLHPRLGSESDNKASPATDSAYASSPCPQSSPSPDDSQKLNVCKHEPIQNIIGKHPPSDILYLICRLCRQTYGSPYCFRKHFRNQHGFEPKSDHTIVQTISATKNAMAHTGSSDVTMSFAGPLDATVAPAGSSDPAMTHIVTTNAILGNTAAFDSTGKLLQPVQVEKLSNDDHSLQNQSIRSTATGATLAVSGQQLLNPVLSEETKLSIKKENLGMTKYLECPECGQTFQLNDFGSYKRHCRQHSLNRSTGPFACHECERSFSEPAHLQEHQTTHSSFTPSVCAVCHTFFSSPNYLADHLQAAHGITSGNGSKQSLTLADKSSESLRRSEPPALTDLSKLRRSSSFPDWSVMGSLSSQRQTFSASISSHSATPSPSGHSITPLTESQALSKPTSMSPTVSVSHGVPVFKPHRYNPTSDNAYMLTVHTPKGLEIQKLPADAVVTTASPDSSYDEVKLLLDVPQGGSACQKDRQEINNGSNNLREGNCQGSGNKSSNTAKLTRPHDNTGSVRYDNKDETEYNCSPVGSGGVSLNSSRAPSPAGNEEESFYKHKKYSLHRKRTNISEPGNEPLTKSLKVEGSNVSVSSTGNSSVTVQDCESSSARLEDSSLRWRINTESQIESDKIIDSTKQEQEDNCVQSKGNKSYGNAGSNKSRDGSKRNVSSEGGGHFKLDRQTRSQAGKIISQ